MIVWCQKCETEPIEEDGVSAVSWFGSQAERPTCPLCPTLGVYDCAPWLISYEGTDGTLYTEELSAGEYARIVSGQGSTPKPAMDRIIESLRETWGWLIQNWTITVGDSEDHIIRSEN